METSTGPLVACLGYEPFFTISPPEEEEEEKVFSPHHRHRRL